MAKMQPDTNRLDSIIAQETLYVHFEVGVFELNKSCWLSVHIKVCCSYASRNIDLTRFTYNKVMTGTVLYMVIIRRKIIFLN